MPFNTATLPDVAVAGGGAEEAAEEAAGEAAGAAAGEAAPLILELATIIAMSVRT